MSHLRRQTCAGDGAQPVMEPRHLAIDRRMPRLVGRGEMTPRADHVDVAIRLCLGRGIDQRRPLGRRRSVAVQPRIDLQVYASGPVPSLGGGDDGTQLVDARHR